MPEGRYTTVIDRLRPHGALAGDIVHLDGRVLGRHEGVTRYTIGQRRGLNVAVGDPLFVVRLDADAPPGDRRPARGPAHRRPDPEGNQLAGRRGVAGGGGGGRQAGPRPRPLHPRAGPGAARPDRRPARRWSSTPPEEGVAPGQACVLYDAAEPEPRAGRRFHRGDGATRLNHATFAHQEPSARRHVRRSRRHRLLRPHAHGRLPGRPGRRQRHPAGGGGGAGGGGAGRRRAGGRRSDLHGLRAAGGPGPGAGPSGGARGAGLPTSVQATTVNKMCGSGMQAAILAHDALAAGSAT